MTMFPTSLPTAVRGLVCNINLNGKTNDDPGKTPAPNSPTSVEAAKKNTEIAKAQEKVAIEKEKQQAMFTTAMDKSRNADEATKAALKLKPTSHQGRKAHQAAAVAHKDAHKHMAGVGGEKSGLANDQRAAAERKAAKHKKMAETHAAMAEGFAGGTAGAGPGPTKNATGCPGVVVNWSDASRTAALEARHGSEHASTSQEHEHAAAYHAVMAEKGGRAAPAHHRAAAAHKVAATVSGNRPEGHKFRTETSGKARLASKTAHIGTDMGPG